jgi:hypothetical protein
MDSRVVRNRVDSPLVLELKCTEQVPTWMIELVQEFDLIRCGNCKYSTAIWMENMLTGMGDAQDAGVFEYAYNPTNGRVASVSNTVSGIMATYAYDLLDRATNITYSASDGSLIRSLEYAYDTAGMITNKVVNDG